ncbi:pentapeptide repeat-containing protein [Hymenobacter psoromatis]|uniref:pentapeptide repeat-containing protein n=1 Tax=Hymenobacter psoromatis TaxID=1484116 RepID=UPI001CBF08B1|nr:pentapeptide repeat-containing protein [Hymenobacter psoromatis]
MGFINNVPRQVLEPLDNETLQRMIAEERRKMVAKYGPSGPDLPVLDDLSLYFISDFDFSGLNLCGIHAHKTVFQRCRFVGADLFGADLSEMVAPGADFQRAILAKSTINDADLSSANFDDANLIRTDFFNCDLRGATFRNADFSGGIVSGCNVAGAIFGPGYVQIM